MIRIELNISMQIGNFSRYRIRRVCYISTAMHRQHLAKVPVRRRRKTAAELSTPRPKERKRKAERGGKEERG